MSPVPSAQAESHRAGAQQSRLLELNRSIVSAVVYEKLTAFGASAAKATARGRTPLSRPRVLLIRGTYATGAPTTFTVKVNDAVRSQVQVRDEHSVLGLVDLVQQQVAADTDDLLVVTTSLNRELGWDVLGHAYGQDVQAVDLSRVIGQRFQAIEVDPRIQQSPWLISALLDAEPVQGWPPAGASLSRDAAISALAAERLGLAAARNDSLDVVALLDWAAEPAGPQRYLELDPVERAGLRPWLRSRAGAGAEAVLSLVEDGKADDLVALGLLCSVTGNPAAGVPLALLLGDVVQLEGELSALWAVVNGLLTRWVSQIESRPDAAASQQLRHRLESIVRRADQLAVERGLVPVVLDHRWLPLAWNNDFRQLVQALDEVLADPTLADPAQANPGQINPGQATPGLVDPARVRSALQQVENHGLARLYPQRRDAARDAVRLTRWLAEPLALPQSVAEAARRHVRDWGWVDRALNVLWAPDTGGDAMVSAGYGRAYQKARRRRDEIDAGAAAHLVAWAGQARVPNTAGVLVVEEVLARVAVPLAGGSRPPLILILDGMSSAVAVELAEHLAREGWFEAAPENGRIAAVSVLPSVTRLSRTSLLTGSLQRGDQRTERDGFTAFWKRHHRDAQLFHKGDLTGAPGHRFAESVRTAVDGEDVVAVVLNTIDEALDHGREGLRTGWSVRDITYLPDLLTAARESARPVLLVADHGHVLERSSQEDPTTRDQGDTSSRWRTGGSVRAGEIEVAGPRVLEGGGRVVLPWRESIRYSMRRAGYHGGAALAETTVPIVVLVPSREQTPAGWQVLAPEAVVPSWWNARHAGIETASAPTRSAKGPGRSAGKPGTGKQSTGKPGMGKPGTGKQGGGKQSSPPQEALFAVEDTPATPPQTTLGALVVASAQYALTRSVVRKPPAPDEVAAVIDALAAADGTMSLSAVAATAGRGGRNPQGLVTTLQRLLNVEGYQVLSQIDGGLNVRLDVALLREQFELTG